MMTKLLILAGSALGIALLVLLARYLWPEVPRLTTAHAKRRYAQTFPDDSITECLDDEKGTAVLLMLADPDAVGLVLRMGDRLTVRRVNRADIAGARKAESHITLALNDFTMPTASFTPKDDHDRQKLATLATTALAASDPHEARHA